MFLGKRNHSDVELHLRMFLQGSYSFVRHVFVIENIFLKALFHGTPDNNIFTTLKPDFTENRFSNKTSQFYCTLFERDYNEKLE